MNKTQISKKMNVFKAFISSQIVETRELKYDLGDAGELVVKVMPVLPFIKRAEMVRMIADLVFINEGKSINDYMPEYVELSKRLNIVSYFTDFKMPKDINDVWLVLNYTSLYDDVAKIVGADIDKIFQEADALIESRRRYLENKTDFNTLFEKITGKLDEFSTQFDENDIQSMMKVIEKIPNFSTENIVKTVANIEKDSEEKIKN